MNSASTSAVLPQKSQSKQTAEEKLIAEIKQAWITLQTSDKDWAKNGRAFGKKCSERRKKYSKQGSRKGLGFEAFCNKNSINYQKARYWADVAEGKKKACYWGSATPKKTTTDPKPDVPKPIPFCLVGVSEAEQGEVIKAAAVIGRVTFSRFIQQAAVEPSSKEVRWLVNHCLSKLDKLQEQLGLLADLRGWIDRQCFELQDQIEAGITVAPRPTPSLAVSFLDADNEVTSVSAGELSSLINKAQQSDASADANTDPPEPTVPGDLFIAQPETADATAGVM